MSSTTEWPEATVKYRLTLFHALHAISPPLSALHASRFAALHPELSAVVQPTHCPKCGTYHFSGDHSSRLVGPSTRKERRRAKSHPKDLHRKCHSCGFSVDTGTSPSLDHSSGPTRPPSGSLKTGIVPVPQKKDIRQGLPTSAIGTVRATNIQPLAGRVSQPKSSHTKTSNLKNMLSRDRQREEDAESKRKRKEGPDGLAAFLREL